ncbi:MAG: hypothetical protein DMG65_21535 [Candidatus Angelobacter sp. Gp1-AA117]|nr:MAG: hypothetical protein DMG65_21535 [Candidatus Angelobacter sp. Gp1-AA117]
MNSLIRDAKPLSVIAGKMLWQVPGRVKTYTLKPLHSTTSTLAHYIKRVSLLLQVTGIRKGSKALITAWRATTKNFYRSVASHNQTALTAENAESAEEGQVSRE